MKQIRKTLNKIKLQLSDSIETSRQSITKRKTLRATMKTMKHK